MPREDGGRGEGHTSTRQDTSEITSNEPKTTRGCGIDVPSQPNEGINPANTLISEPQPPELGGNKCLLLKPPGLWGFDMAAPANGYVDTTVLLRTAGHSTSQQEAHWALGAEDKIMQAHPAGIGLWAVWRPVEC